MWLIGSDVRLLFKSLVLSSTTLASWAMRHVCGGWRDAGENESGRCQLVQGSSHQDKRARILTDIASVRLVRRIRA